MPTQLETRSFPPELLRAWGSEGQDEYNQLLRVTRAARGSFFLFLIESDYPPALQDMLLDCLRADLSQDLRLRRVELTAADWDVSRLSDLETCADSDEVIVLVGLEKTPGLVQEPGRTPKRPPIYALLNCLRETLHLHLPAPLLVWCTPPVYTGLQTHAPDFFDHYAGLFQFKNADPEEPSDRLPVVTSAKSFLSPSTTSPSAIWRLVEFYEQQLTQHLGPTRERAHTLLGIADALAALRGPNNLQHIQHALAVVDEALTLLSSKYDAYEWARGQILKGIAYGNLPTGDRGENISRAIACYEAALQIYTLENFPHDWAGIQNNLGNAYGDLPTGDRGENISRAIACYEAALQVCTEEQFPYDWAQIQNNLAIAYSIFPLGDRSENLHQGIAFYEVALRVRTEERFPRQWAQTQFNLAMTFAELNDAVSARHALLNAVRGFRTVGLEKEAQRAEAILQSEDWQLPS